MRGLAMASLISLGVVSAVTGTIAAVALVGKDASACNYQPSPDDDSSQPADFRKATFRLRTKGLTTR